MRTLSILASTILAVGCVGSLMPGGGGGGGGTTASLGGGDPTSGSPADQFQSPVEMPNQVKRIVYARDKVNDAIAELEKGAANGQLDEEHFHHARVYFTIEYFEALIGGGVPACDVCKNNPKWKELHDEFPKFSARYMALEKKFFKCDYGFMMEPDKFLPLSADWTIDDYKSLIKKAKPAGQGQKNHCWKSPKDYDWAY
jgi:hypothetical protein